MKYRFFSDIHLERDAQLVKRPSVSDLWRPEELAGDAQTTLILAGDIWNGIRPITFAGRSWLTEIASRFKAVVIVFGNHDYWGDSLPRLATKWKERISEVGLRNVHVLEAADGPEFASVVIDGVTVVGSTLWTDMDRGNSAVLHKFDFETGFDGRALWNDRNYIKAAGYARFSAKHWLARHRHSLKGVKAAVSQANGPVLLVTHHAPCLTSAQDRMESDLMAGHLYASDLSDYLMDTPSIRQVIHGHTHTKLDYEVGSTRVMCNPRGYAPSYFVSGFDADGAFEI